MEKTLKIKTTDHKTIQGMLRGSIKKPLIILVHGLCSNMNEALHYNATRYFEKEGFSCFRFNLYSWEKGSRKLHECTLKTHGEDIDVVLNFLKLKGAKKLFIVGHSYGLPSILHSKSKIFDAVVSWDGSFFPHSHFDKSKSIKMPVKGIIIDESGHWAIMSEAMVRESHTVNSIGLIKSLDKPVKFITIPKKTGNLSGAKKMYAASKQEKELKIIVGASHNFTEEGKEEMLYKETTEWLKRFI